MSEYTAHVQMPDAPLGSVFYNLVMQHNDITFAATRSGQSTWLSFGVDADSDDHAQMKVGTIRHDVSRMKPEAIPELYEESAVEGFKHCPMIVTNGRTVVHSEWI